jgi:hypothetical protein
MAPAFMRSTGILINTNGFLSRSWIAPGAVSLLNRTAASEVKRPMGSKYLPGFFISVL